jgi:pimeloyl-ACP methyl ester carboxylesterase
MALTIRCTGTGRDASSTTTTTAVATCRSHLLRPAPARGQAAALQIGASAGAETWARRAYRNLVYFNEADKGDHFAAWEQPELFAQEIRAAFRSLQQHVTTSHTSKWSLSSCRNG